MDILGLRDLVKDEYGNYYEIIQQSNDEIVLVNTFVHYTFRRLLHFDEDFKKEFKEYEWQYIGKFFMDMLKNRVDGLETGKYPGKIYDMKEVMKEYTVNVIPFYDKNPSAK
jgi:hypothetical protein